MTQELYIDGLRQVKAYRILQARVASIVKAHELGSVSEWFVLAHVYSARHVMAKDVAALLEVEAPLITRLVNNLIRAGLVTITPDLTDKRVKFIHPTSVAEVLVPKIQAALKKDLAELLKGTTKSDMQAYQKVLRTIQTNGEKL
jgi:DNA-binding MarR family transcriptional regulator